MRFVWFFLFVLYFLMPVFANAQSVTLSGVVCDAETGERLINATVINNRRQIGVLTNEYGFYSIKIDGDNAVQIECRYVGYKSHFVIVEAVRDTFINFNMEKGIDIEEVLVTSDRAFNLEVHQPGITGMKGEDIIRMSSLMGEPDLARSLQLMPGVQAGKEGTGGLFVRGGSPGQNLILLDGMPVYSPNHIAGFVSVFNPVPVNYLKLYKGGFPAQFGGRTSSVLDIRMRDGNMQKHSGSYSYGTITGNFCYEGPIRKDTSSFLIAGRRTIFDLFVMGFILLDTNGESTAGYNLWDINLKYNKKINDQTRFFMSFYKGQDQIFKRTSDNSQNDYLLRRRYNNSWGNTVASFRLNKIYSSKLFANYTFGFSNYRYQIKDVINMIGESPNKGKNLNNFKSSVSDFVLSADYQYMFNDKHSFNFGLQTNFHMYSPIHNQAYWKADEVVLYDSIWGANNVFSPELAAYFADTYRIGYKLTASIGGRIVTYLFDEISEWSLEPRMSFNYKVNRSMLVSLSYDRMAQFTHLVNSTEQSLPSDMWFPSTKNILPEKSNQYSLGTFYTFTRTNDYNLSFDLYYKQMYNLVENSEGLSFRGAGSDWSKMIVGNGSGKAWGAEFFAERKTGRFTGSIAYTLSKNMRKFDNLNNAEWYPFRYDRRHELAIMLNYKINEHVNFALNWVYMSGEAATLPKYKYMLDVQQFYNENVTSGETFSKVFYSESRNSFRMPAYHRFDFSFNFEREVYRGIRTWSLGLYNAYNRMNSYYLYYDKDKQGEIKLYSITLFPVMPSISYSLKF